MKNESKTERQLVQELIELRRQVAEMEKIEAERKRAEEALRESEKRYREVVESAEEIIHTTDIQGNFTFANAASLRAAGTSLEKFKQLNYLGIIHPDHRQRLSEIYINQFRERKATIYVEFPILSRSGEVIWLGQNSSLMFEGKKVVGFHSVARDITERKQMEETLRRSEEEAKRLAQENVVMAEIGRIISSTLNIEEIYERFIEEVRKLIQGDRVTITIVNRDGSTYTLAYAWGLEVGNRKTGGIFPLAGTTVEEAMRTRSSMLTQEEDIEKVLRSFPTLALYYKAGLQSMIVVPLISKNSVIGTLHFRTLKPKAYTQTDVLLAERVGNQIAGAIANAQLFAERKQAEEAARRSEEEAQRLAEENAVMAEIGRIISSTLDIEEVYEPFAQEMSKLIPCDRTAFNIINPEERTASTVYASGIKIPSHHPGEVFPLAGSATEKAEQAKSGLIIKTEDENEVRDQVPGLLPAFRAGIRSVMMIPLISRDKVIGVLTLQSTKAKAYSKRDLSLAERVANQIAGAITNAQLFAERKKAEEEREKLVCDLQKALSEVKKLSGFLPICASCKKIRDDKGYWNQVEVYIRDRSEAEFSHGICPDCMKKLYPDFYKEDK